MVGALRGRDFCVKRVNCGRLDHVRFVTFPTQAKTGPEMEHPTVNIEPQLIGVATDLVAYI